MDGLNDIISRLEAQKAAIEKALAALQEVGGISSAPAIRVKRAYKRRAVKKSGSGISAAGRERLAEAMKRRWAAKRAASAVKKPGRKKA